MKIDLVLVCEWICEMQGEQKFSNLCRYFYVIGKDIRNLVSVIESISFINYIIERLYIVIIYVIEKMAPR